MKTTSTKSVTLTSSGTGPLTISRASLAGTGFTMTGASFPTTLQPNQSVTLQVSFDPTVAGTATGSITVTSDAASGGTAQIALSGTGTAAAVPQLTVSTSSVAFGNVTVKTTSTKSVTLTSSGTGPLTISRASLAGTGFTMTGASFPTTLQPNQSVTLQVSFDPTVAGAATGSITVTSDAASGGTAQIALSGTGTAAPAPQLTVSTNSLAFGTVNIGTPATSPLTLTSTGTSAVTVSAASITGAGFTYSGAAFPVTLNPGVAITVQVKFDPASAVASTGSLVFSNDSTAGAATVTLTGTGTAVQHQVTLTWSPPASSPTPVMAYHVYRATGSSTSFTMLHSTSVPQYVDQGVVSGTTYSYYVKSADNNDDESAASNQATVTVP